MLIKKEWKFVKYLGETYATYRDVWSNYSDEWDDRILFPISSEKKRRYQTYVPELGVYVRNSSID